MRARIGYPAAKGTGGTTGPGLATRLTFLGRSGHALVTGLDPATPMAVARRLYDLGFREDATVSCIRRAPLGSPTIYRIGESDVCLRRAEAYHVRVRVAQ